MPHNIMLHSDYEIEDLGIQERTVYDMETENHTFVANDILVHNSVYVDISPFSKTKKSSVTFPKMTRDEKIDFYDIVCKNIEKNSIQPSFDFLAHNLNFMRKDNLKMKRENIAAGVNENGKAALWIAKKHYLMLTDDKEGVRYDKSHMKAMGLCFQQTVYAKVFREKMKEVIRVLIEQGPEKARKIVQSFIEEVHKMDLAELSLIRGVTNVTKYTDALGNPKKGAGVHIRASIYFNRLVKKLKLENKYAMIHNGSKIRFIYLKPNPEKIDVIAFVDSLPKEFNLHGYVDYDMILEKSFLKPMEDMFEAMNSSIEEKFEIDDLFG